MNFKLKKFLILLILLIFYNSYADSKNCDFCIPEGSDFKCEEIKEALQFLNSKIRAEVNVPPLEWDCKLALSSQKWAEVLAEKGYLEHSKQRIVGENLYMYYSSYGKIPYLKEAIESWYSEKKNFVYGKKYWCKEGTICGHYTQLVWKETKKIGCGRAEKNNKVFIVCRFIPAGNFIGEQPY